jgi:hypothetical protein
MLRRIHLKSLRSMLFVVVMSLSVVAFSQTEGPKSEAPRSFDNLKSLAGSWEGHMTPFPQADTKTELMHATLRVTSMGNALVMR